MKKKIALTAMAIVPSLCTISATAQADSTVNYENTENINASEMSNDVTVIETIATDRFMQTEDKLTTDGIKKVINRSSVNIRKGPGTEYSVVKMLDAGVIVDVVGENGSWSKVNLGGEVLYVSTLFISDLSDEQLDVELKQNNVFSNIKTKTKTTKIMKVTANNLRFRSEPGCTESLIKTLANDKEVELISTDNGWSKIKVDGKTGYVSSYYLQFERNETTEIIDNNKTNGSENSVDYSMSLDEHINLQLSESYNVLYDDSYRDATYDDLSDYMNPENFKTPEQGSLQFARLDKYQDVISADDLNNYLNRYCQPGNVFHNKGQAFINAAKENNINVVYFVAHSMIETGYGKSKLAMGQEVNGQTVYNFFGIGAYDGQAVLKGSEAAYKYGWTSVDKGIDGAAEWISSRYIHSSKYDQNTLYEMKWNRSATYHQYATDIRWATSIAQKMNSILNYGGNPGAFDYEIPNYR